MRRGWLVIGSFLTAASLAASAPARGALQGRVTLLRPPEAAARRPNVNDLGMAPARDADDRRRSVVYLEEAPRGAFAREERRARMDQRNETFVPHILAVTTGTTVDFLNNDRTYHNVFSLSRTRPFDLGRYAAGQSKPVRFDRPGIVRVFCDIHSHMSAFILVFAHRYFAVTDATGAYRLDDVPPGSYTVAIWHESLSAAPQSVTVDADGKAVDVNFTLERR